MADEWEPGTDVFDYLADAVPDATSALWVSGERALAAEFPDHALARQVLSAIGSGERTYSLIGRAAGGLQNATLSRALKVLSDKRVVTIEKPLSTRPSRESRYLVADPHLRFWLAFLAPHYAELERGRGDLIMQRIRTSWTAWRGRAIEPLVREALFRLPHSTLPAVIRRVSPWSCRTAARCL